MSGPRPDARFGAHALYRALDKAEWVVLRALVGARPWPFGPGAEAALDTLLSRADDDEMELVIRCCALLGGPEAEQDAEAAATNAPVAERLTFVFDRLARDLGPFIDALGRNGLEAQVMEAGDDVVVWVTLVADSDQEFRRELDLVNGLKEFARGIHVTRLAGRRVGATPIRLSSRRRRE